MLKAAHDKGLPAAKQMNFRQQGTVPGLLETPQKAQPGQHSVIPRRGANLR